MSRPRSFALALWAAFAVSGCSHASWTDPRDRAVVVYDLAAGSWCSGVLVEADLVLTAAHCVIRSDGTARPAADLAVGTGADARTPDRLERVVGARALAAGRCGGEDVRDLAALRVAHPLGARPDRSSRSAPRTGDPLVVLGFGLRDGAIGRLSPRFVEVIAHRGDHLLTTAGTCAGDSGAGAFDRDGRLVAIASRIASARCGAGTSILAVVPDSLYAHPDCAAPPREEPDHTRCHPVLPVGICPDATRCVFDGERWSCADATGSGAAGEACDDHTDCEAGRCEAGTCRQACVPGAGHCPFGELCDDGLCVVTSASASTRATSEACEVDTDCRSGWCELGACVERCEPGSCPPGTRCVDGACQLGTGELGMDCRAGCGWTQECVRVGQEDTRCAPPCLGDVDCPSGMSCRAPRCVEVSRAEEPAGHRPCGGYWHCPTGSYCRRAADGGAARCGS